MVKEKDFKNKYEEIPNEKPALVTSFYIPVMQNYLDGKKKKKESVNAEECVKGVGECTLLFRLHSFPGSTAKTGFRKSSPLLLYDTYQAPRNRSRQLIYFFLLESVYTYFETTYSAAF